jgi:hypothetical protein
MSDFTYMYSTVPIHVTFERLQYMLTTRPHFFWLYWKSRREGPERRMFLTQARTSRAGDVVKNKNEAVYCTRCSTTTFPKCPTSPRCPLLQLQGPAVQR